MVLVVVAVAFVAGVYFVFYRPTQQLNEWAMNGDQGLSEEQVRQIAHRMISLPWGNHHGAFLALAKVGNRESIPYLIRALRWQAKPDSNGVVVCTTHHCSRCLWNLTGMWFRSDYGQWNRWWREVGCHLSAEQLRQQASAAHFQVFYGALESVRTNLENQVGGKWSFETNAGAAHFVSPKEAPPGLERGSYAIFVDHDGHQSHTLADLWVAKSPVSFAILATNTHCTVLTDVASDHPVSKKIIQALGLEEVSLSLLLSTADNGKTVAVKVGQPVAITLKGNPTTGYLWSVAGLSSNTVEQVGEVEYRRDEAGKHLVGSGGVFVATFKAAKPGQTTVRMEYRRPWEKDVAPIETFSATIEVTGKPTP